MLQGVLIGSLANRSASDGIDVFPGLGYKKDTVRVECLLTLGALED